MSTIMLRVSPSPNEELPEQYVEGDWGHVFTKNFLIDKCMDRERIIDEISHELVVLRNNYEEVLRRLNKYEPTEELPEEEYDPNKYKFQG